jgi:CubicO group peptidase (beta-lactamase class C family)
MTTTAKILACLGALMAGGAIIGTAMAEAADSTTFPPPLDAQQVVQFVDSEVEPALQSSGVPGALVVIVRRDHVVMSKGYGVSDIRTRAPVRADSTLFDIASIGKSMTAVITEQFLEQHRLELDSDINRYLKSAPVSGPPVTLRALLGHRGGFDADLTGWFVPMGGDIRMRTGELRRRLRPLVPPGFATAYDNVGFGLIGLALRDVSGKSLPELYRERLFGPAGMSGAVLGMPPDGNQRLARCYTVQGPRAIQECEYWLYREGLMGAGGVAATGDDMARYMRLLLNGGTLDGREIISQQAFADLTDFDEYRFHAGMPGFARSFTQFEELRGTEYGHGGSMPGFSSLMKLYPDADIGIFVSFLGGQPKSFDFTPSNLVRSGRDTSVLPTAREGFNTLESLPDRIADRFIPATRPRSSEVEAQPAAAIAAATADPVEEFRGRYVLAQMRSRTLEMRQEAWLTAVEVQTSGPGALRLSGPYTALGEFQRIAPLLYESKSGKRLAFAKLPVGRYMAISLSGGTYRQTNLIESPAWSLPLFALSLLVILSALIQLRRKAPPRLRRLGVLTTTGMLLVIVGLLAEWQWGVALGVIEGAIFRPLLWRGALLGGVILLVWGLIRYVARPRMPLGWVERAHGALICVAAGVTVGVLCLWRVLGAFPPYFSW